MCVDWWSPEPKGAGSPDQAIVLDTLRPGLRQGTLGPLRKID